jgi:hypothetical protein
MRAWPPAGLVTDWNLALRGFWGLTTIRPPTVSVWHLFYPFLTTFRFAVRAAKRERASAEYRDGVSAPG